MQKQLSFLFGSFSFIILIFIVLSVIDGQGDFFPDQNDEENDEENGEEETLNEEEFFYTLDNTINFVYSETGEGFSMLEESEEKIFKLSVDFSNEFYNYEEFYKTEVTENWGSEYKNEERFDFLLEIDVNEYEVLYEEYETIEGENFGEWETIGSIQYRDPAQPLGVFANYLEQEVDFEDIDFSYFEFEGENLIGEIFLDPQGYQFSFTGNNYHLKFENSIYEVGFDFSDSENFFEFYDLIDFDQKNID